LLASGAVSEPAYYRSLARHLGLSYAGDLPPLGSGTAYPETITTGVAPLATAETGGPAWLLAPQGRRISELLTLQRRRTLPTERFVIAPPGKLRDGVFTSCAPEIAEHAANSLAAGEPGLSARNICGRYQTIVLGALALLLIAGLAAGGAFWLLVSFLAGSILSGSIMIRLFATAGSCDAFSREFILAARTGAGRDDDRNLPVYAIIAALYREAGVAAQFTHALQRIDYPAGKLDIKLVVEADDDATRQALEALDLPANFQIISVPAGTPRTKPRALNAALGLARGEYTCVFDAEDLPEAGQLREAAHVFARSGETVACLQGRLYIDNIRDSWLTRMFAIEYAALFDVINPGLAWLRMPIPLGGTSNHFRTDVLRKLWGWDDWNVTEDADLGLRLAQFGYRTEALASSTGEEAPDRPGMWMRQRRRWIKGWMQTLLVHMRSPRRSVRGMGPQPATVAFLHFAGSLLGLLLGPMFAVVTIHQLLWGDLLSPASAMEIVVSTCWCFVFVAGTGAALWPIFLGMKRRQLRGLTGWLASLPLYWLLQTFAAWWALADLIRDPFHWHKTDHGVSRAPRNRP